MINKFYQIFILMRTLFCFKINKTTYKSKLINSHLNNNSNSNQSFISSINKENNLNLFLNTDTNKYYLDKKLITISPGGYKGFYILGVLTFIKENYETEDLIFSGASAGAWNSLFMCYKAAPLEFVYNLLDINIIKSKSISDLQYSIKYKLLSSYKNDDFDLKKLFIGVTTFNKFTPNINIYSNFSDLEDAINCCMASSHIPLITGGFTNRYKNMFSLDGGFSTYPYLNKEPLLHISFSMWDNLKKENQSNFLKQSKRNLIKFSDFFSISKNNIVQLFDNGYSDAKLHRNYFDKILKPKIIDESEF